MDKNQQFTNLTGKTLYYVSPTGVEAGDWLETKKREKKWKIKNSNAYQIFIEDSLGIGHTISLRYVENGNYMIKNNITLWIE